MRKQREIEGGDKRRKRIKIKIKKYLKTVLINLKLISLCKNLQGITLNS